MKKLTLLFLALCSITLTTNTTVISPLTDGALAGITAGITTSLGLAWLSQQPSNESHGALIAFVGGTLMMIGINEAGQRLWHADGKDDTKTFTAALNYSTCGSSLVPVITGMWYKHNSKSCFVILGALIGLGICRGSISTEGK